MFFVQTVSISISVIVFLHVVTSLQEARLQVNDSKSQSNNDPNPLIREYCLTTESFEARCLKNEVVVMDHAVYGRMRIGRCLQDEGDDIATTFGNDPRFLGCSVDVLELLDQKCSGRNQCTHISYHDFQSERPCHGALKSYLEASYSCLTVIEEDRACSVAVTSNPLHIMHSSSSSSKLSCGTKSQPWRLEAPAGQQINVSLLDFGVKSKESNQQHCRQYGYIRDRSSKTNISICGSDTRRKILFKSSSNVIELVVVINQEGSTENTEQYRTMFAFQGDIICSSTRSVHTVAIGCSNIVPPEDTWLRRNDNEAMIGCYSSRQTWQLRCTGNHWVGAIGNCSRVDSDTALAFDVRSSATSHDYQVLIMLSISFLALVICLIVICFGAVCLKRYYAVKARKYFAKLAGNSKSIPSLENHNIQSSPQLQFQ